MSSVVSFDDDVESTTFQEASTVADSDDEDDTVFLGLQPRCGACAGHIDRHERVIALIGNQDSSDYATHTQPFAFPQPRYAYRSRIGDSNYVPCRRPECSLCLASPEAIPVHYACFQVYVGCSPAPRSEALSRLFLEASWRNPWSRAPPLNLTPGLVPRIALDRMAAVAGLGPLGVLPAELIEMIRQLCPDELFWDSLAVGNLVERVSRPPAAHIDEVPLVSVASWERDGELVRSASPVTLPPVIRVTLDAEGISKIERLHHWPVYRSETTNRLAYIVEDQSTLGGSDCLQLDQGALDYLSLHVRVQFKNGRARLQVPGWKPSLRIWNSPAPPHPSLCTFIPATDVWKWRRFRIMDLSRIRGLTFFYSCGEIYGVHVHYDDEACAMSTFERIPKTLQPLWLHVPLAPQDSVLVVATRPHLLHGFSMLIRTKLSGDIMIGRQCIPTKDYYVGAGDPITLIYGEPREGRPCDIFGAYCPDPMDKSAIRQFDTTLYLPPYPAMDAEYTYMSWAPLRNVRSTQVFYDAVTGLCKGLIFHYNSGGCRALGQCRLHVDPHEVQDNPKRFCFRRTAFSTRTGVSAGGFAEGSSDEDWSSRYSRQAVRVCIGTDPCGPENGGYGPVKNPESPGDDVVLNGSPNEHGHHHGDGSTECGPMTGVVYFWSMESRSNYLVVVRGPHGPHANVVF